MEPNVVKGYLLTYLGWLFATLFSVGITYFLTDLFFKSELKTIASSTGSDALNGLVATLAGLLVATIFAGFVFQLSMLILNPLLIFFSLKSLPKHRKSTILWIFGLLFLTPFLLAFMLLIHITGVSLVIVVAVWITESPGLARFLATRNLY